MQLQGIRVVDLSRILSGPFCSMFLADMGAEVIKIEAVEDGDPVCQQGMMRNGFSLYFASFNRNKKSLTLDLRAPKGREVLTRLIPTVDVVLDNFRPGIMEKIGFSRAELVAIKPDIISCHITGFGLDGPYRDRPSFDFIAQAMSGFMSVNGAEGEPPARAAPPLSDLIAGACAAMGICAALVRRARTGLGEEVATSLTDGMVANLAFLAAHYFGTGEQPLRTGNDHALVAPYGLFEAADGKVAIAPSNDLFYYKLIDALGLSELREHPEFRTNADRFARREAINAIVDAAIRKQPIAHWLDVLNAAGVPCGRVMGLQEVFDDPQVRHQEMRITIDHLGTGPSTCSASRSSSPTIPAACIGRRRTSASTPTRCWLNWAITRRRSRVCALAAWCSPRERCRDHCTPRHHGAPCATPGSRARGRRPHGGPVDRKRPLKESTMNFTQPMQERPKVHVTEVGTRDGFQVEPVLIPAATKAEVIDALIGAGIRRLEATSFVSPRAVPQLADAHDVLSRVQRRAEAHLAALVPNARGAERALGAGVNEMVCFVSASETHNQANLNASIAASLTNVAEIAGIARGAVALRGAVACAFGCPFEGEVPVDAALRIVEAYAGLGMDRVSLGDTTGMATPPTVARLVEAIRSRFPELRIALHFHNTRGVGLANVMVGLDLGVVEYESSIAGLGGCPFAPGATGNICTEDLVYLLEESGFDTGIDLEALIAVAQRVEAIIGRPLPGQVMKAGPRLRRFALDGARRAVG